MFKDELLKIPDLDSLVSVEREACLENFIVLFLFLVSRGGKVKHSKLPLNDFAPISNILVMYKVSVNGNKSFSVEGNTVDGRQVLTDIIALEDRFFHLLSDGKSYNIEVVKADKTSKLVTLKVNGNTYEVSAKDKFDLLMDQMGFSSADAGKIKELKAPMPGLVIEIRVKAGDTVKKGDPIIVLEAMKMENVLKATGEGTVKSIEVQKSQSVEKGQVLIIFE